MTSEALNPNTKDNDLAIPEPQNASEKRILRSNLVNRLLEARMRLKMQQFELEFAEADEDMRMRDGGGPRPGYLLLCKIVRNIPF